MNPKEFFDAVRRMRKLQKDYYSTRDKQILKQCIDAEKAIDAEISRVESILGNNG